MNDWKKRLGVLYSTNPDFQYQTDENEEQETLPKEKQNLRVCIDKSNRKGKEVVLVSGFIGMKNDLESLCRELKKRLGVGGSSKNGDIIIQGSMIVKVIEVLRNMGYTKTR